MLHTLVIMSYQSKKRHFFIFCTKRSLRAYSSDLQVEMYETVISYLKENGFHQYEVSNYAKAIKYESLHNKIYWSLYPMKDWSWFTWL